MSGELLGGEGSPSSMNWYWDLDALRGKYKYDNFFLSRNFFFFCMKRCELGKN